MKNTNSSGILQYQIQKKVSERLIKRYYPHLSKKGNGYNDMIAEIKDKIKYRTKDITMKKFLDIESNKGTQYKPYIIDIAYIITLIYDDEQYEKTKKTFKNKIITEMGNTLEANELASIFLPFYDRKNWEYPDEEYLKKHEKTFHRFLKLQEYDPRSCLSDIKQFCKAFYNHEELPPMEKYNELIEIHKKYKSE